MKIDIKKWRCLTIEWWEEYLGLIGRGNRGMEKTTLCVA
jgi:hypothetical protein